MPLIPYSIAVKTAWAGAMNRPTHIIIHRTASKGGAALLIDEDHRHHRGFAMIGYHWLIGNGRPTWGGGEYDPALDGLVEQGRTEEMIGAHCVGYNGRSIGIALVGDGPKFTDRQWLALHELVRDVRRRYGIARERVLGHDETPDCAPEKVCPNFDMAAFRASLPE